MSAMMLASLGQAAGGPFGALTGSLIGGVADGALRRSGSRTDTAGASEQSASYGAIVPAVFGRLRTAGTVVWSQPMRRAGGGKGGGQRSYVASLAIALSARRILRIERIWADGREIRSAEGDSEFAMTFRLLPAGGTQAVDPLIAAIEGMEQTPGYRGLSVIVFEDFPLASFGNRIPQLEFEVVADESGASFGSWLSEAAGLNVWQGNEQVPRPIVGWPVSGQQLRQDMASAIRVSGSIVAEQDGALAVRAEGKLHTLFARDVVEHDGKVAREIMRKSSIMPMAAMVDYADPDRGFLVGEQQAFQSAMGAPARLSLAIAMPAASARNLARAMLLEGDTASEFLRFQVSFRFIGIVVGDRVMFDDDDRLWLVIGRLAENFVVTFECIRWREGGEAQDADPGRADLLPIAFSRVARIGILELPTDIGSLVGGGVVVGVSASGQWRGAELLLDDGASTRSIGFARNAVLAGTLASVLFSGPETIWDDVNSVDVDLDFEDGWIESREALAVLAGANLAWVGGELLQFREAFAVGAGRFRLAGLLRGRFGTKVAVPAHAVGTPVWIFAADDMRGHAMNADLVGRTLKVALLSGDSPVETEHDFAGLGHAPMGPCHVRAVREADGDIRISWIERRREYLDWHNVGNQSETLTAIVEIREGANVVSRRTNATQITVTKDEQIAISGAPFGDPKIRVTIDGVGPEEFRSSAMADLR